MASYSSSIKATAETTHESKGSDCKRKIPDVSSASPRIMSRDIQSFKASKSMGTVGNREDIVSDKGIVMGYLERGLRNE